MPGLVLYKVANEGDERRLTGTWTTVGSDGHTYTERLTRVKANVRRPERDPELRRREREPDPEPREPYNIPRGRRRSI